MLCGYSDDFSVAVGLQSASNAQGPPALGDFVKNFNLVALGHSTTVCIADKLCSFRCSPNLDSFTYRPLDISP